MNAVSVRLEDWVSAARTASKLADWGFRGQAIAAWPLESTLFRLAAQYGCPPFLLNQREYWMHRQFQRRAFDHLKGIPALATSLDWLSLIQHHGGPTRLLDFSHSFYVAAFFALETSQDDAAVWAIRLAPLYSKIAAVMKADTDYENPDHRNARHALFLNKFLSLDWVPGMPLTKDASVVTSRLDQLVVPVEPELMYQRLTAQQGFFLCQTDLLSSFESNLSVTLGGASASLDLNDTTWADFSQKPDDYDVAKIVLPKRLHYEVLRDLQKMNITSATLFPGLDGFARSMRLHVQEFGLLMGHAR